MFELLVLSLGLAMDSFAVSLVRGSSGERSLARAVEIGFAFGLAQGLMPLIGWGLGKAFEGPFQAFDHWIAFVLLFVLGVRMLREALAPRADDAPSSHSHIVAMATAAFATSVDAAAAGLTLPLLGVPVPLACVTIGVTTALLCIVGYELGSRVSGRVGKRAEFVGGLVLIGLGTKILIEHLGA
jgi:putative Mn2+ efflux pump MntP